jgi:hypothetical protein
MFMTDLSGSSAILDVTNYDLKQAPWHCDQLERGKVLFFSHVPFVFPDSDREFLLSQKQTGSRFIKTFPTDRRRICSRAWMKIHLTANA